MSARGQRTKIWRRICKSLLPDHAHQGGDSPTVSLAKRNGKNAARSLQEDASANGVGNRSHALVESWGLGLKQSCTCSKN